MSPAKQVIERATPSTRRPAKRRVPESDEEKEKPRGSSTTSTKGKAGKPVEVSAFFAKKPKDKAQEKVTLPSPKKDVPKKQIPPVSESRTQQAPVAKPALNQPENAQSVLDTIPMVDMSKIETPEVQKFDFAKYRATHSQDDTSHQGIKVDIPEGKDNCLLGLTFVITGILDMLTRDEAKDLLTRYGAKVTGAPSRNTSFVLMGKDAGPSKIKKIKELNIKVINEEGLFELLKRMPEGGGTHKGAQMAASKQEKDKKAAESLAKEFSDLKHKENSQVNEHDELWTTKYAPKSIKEICGNKKAVSLLSEWLNDWPKNLGAGFKKPGKDGLGIYRAVLISGPPGIGKTTAAHVVAKDAGYDIIETNASDTRNKQLLAAKVTPLLSNQSLMGFYAPHGEKIQKSEKKVALIMDEVDGMSAGDRGGVGEMAALCKKTQIPIIMICNDKSLPKLRPFDKVTFDMPFRRPDANMIRSRILMIAFREHIKISPVVIDQLVESTHADIRQIINILSSFARTSTNMDIASGKKISKESEKHVALKPFDIAAKFLGGSMFGSTNGPSLNDKIELYFNDFDFVPLMIQENYANVQPRRARSSLDSLKLYSEAADSISDSDLVDRRIRGPDQLWTLMPFHAVMSTVRPSSFIYGHLQGRINFTKFLGMNSSRGKFIRLLQEIQSHMRIRVPANKQQLRLQYQPVLVDELTSPLINNQKDGVESVIEVMDYYYLTLDDRESLISLCVDGKDTKILASIPKEAKSALTRKYNATNHPTPFIKTMASMAGAKPRKIAPDFEDAVIEDDFEEAAEKQDEKEAQEAQDEYDNDITKDKNIKMARPKAAASGKRARASTGAKSASASSSARKRTKTR